MILRSDDVKGSSKYIFLSNHVQGRFGRQKWVNTPTMLQACSIVGVLFNKL